MVCKVSKILNEFKRSNKIIQTAILGKDRISESLPLLYQEYFVHENICAAVELSSNPKASYELAHLAEITAEDGISAIAIEKDSDKIVGVSYNKIIPSTSNFFEDYKNNHCTQDSSLAILTLISDLNSSFDAYKMFNVNCVAELLFLSVLSEYRNIGLGFKLTEDVLHYLESVPDNYFGNFPNPELAISITTSAYTYKIGEKLDATDVIRKEFSDYQFKGKFKYSEKVDCALHTQGFAVIAKKIHRQNSE